jgi:cyclohexanone monooxygenase/pentalenolactone D synthase
VEVFDVSAEAEAAWTQKIVDSFVDGSAVMSACTPSRINNEGHPEAMNPRNGNYGRGMGDWFGYRELLEQWLEAGRFDGLELEVRSTAS